MNDYEAKKQARIERIRDRADAARGEAAGRYSSFRRTSDMIPLGQPILVGHHSERRHRRDIARMDANLSKMVQLQKHADELERRAENAESNRAISSDDPTAIERLTEKLRSLEEAQRVMKGVNAGLRSGKTAEEITAAFPDIVAGVGEKRRKPDLARRSGFESFSLTNNNAQIRSVKARIAQLSKQAVAETPAPEQIGDVRIEESENRVRVFFPGKPSEDVRKQLKSFGFKWSPTAGAWQRHAGTQAWYWARHIATSVQP